MSKANAGKPGFWRFGFLLGSMARVYAKAESRLYEWLNRKGSISVVSRSVLWSIRLVCVGTVLYASYWLVVGAVICWIIGGLTELDLPQATDDEGDDGWRDGHAGFGDYCGGYRVDPGRFDDHE